MQPLSGTDNLLTHLLSDVVSTGPGKLRRDCGCARAAGRTGCTVRLAACSVDVRAAHRPRAAASSVRRNVTTAALARASLNGPLLPEEGAVVGAGGDLFVFGDDFGAPNTTNLTDCTSYLGPLPLCVGVDEHKCHAGTFHAASLLLRKQFGMRWVWPGNDGIVRPVALGPQLGVSPTLLIRAAPTLEMRRLRGNPAHSYLNGYLGGWLNASVLTEYKKQEAMWMLRNGLGGRTVFLGGWAEWRWQDFGNTHPEWFALHRDGTRGCQTDAHCKSNPSLAKADCSSTGLVQHVAAQINARPGLKGVSACEHDDNAGFCTCSKCRALDPPSRSDSPLGSLSDRYAAFWNSIHRELRRIGRPEAWVAGYAYDNYTDAPLHQIFDNESKVLIQSVGFLSVLNYSRDTVESRAAWAGWVESGVKAMALRPNSLWQEYSGLPFVFSDQWLQDVQWCGRHGMVAADFDSLVGDWQAVGHSYYALARTLWSPAKANLSSIREEYYSAYGAAAGAMRSYNTFWQTHLQTTNTDPRHLRRAQVVGDSRAQYVLAGTTYSADVLSKAATFLAYASTLCGAANSPSCIRVTKAATHLDYTRKVAAASNATSVIKPQLDRHGLWAEPIGSNVTVPAGDIVLRGRALQNAAIAIADQAIVNVYYTLAYANSRGDLLGLLAAA